MTKAWTGWQDWAEVVIGVLVLLSPLVVATTTGAVWTMVVLGALIAVDGLASLANPGVVHGDWIGGVLTAAAGAMALPLANAAHTRRTHRTHGGNLPGTA